MNVKPETMSQPMETTTIDRHGDGEWIESPVDDATYDLLMALSSKLEAIDTYRAYAEDGHAELARAGEGRAAPGRAVVRRAQAADRRELSARRVRAWIGRGRGRLPAARQ